MHHRLGSATLSQLAFPGPGGGGEPEFPMGEIPSKPIGHDKLVYMTPQAAYMGHRKPIEHNKLVYSASQAAYVGHNKAIARTP